MIPLPLTKVCPSCNAQLHKHTAVCSYCGYDYSVGAVTPETSAQVRQKSTREPNEPLRLPIWVVVMSLILGFLLLVILLINAAWTMPNPTAARRGLGIGIGSYGAGVIVSIVLARWRRTGTYWLLILIAFALGLWIGLDLATLGHVDWPPFSN